MTRTFKGIRVGQYYTHHPACVTAEWGGAANALAGYETLAAANLNEYISNTRVGPCLVVHWERDEE